MSNLWRLHAPRGYHNAFTPNCSCRGVFACDVTTPNEVDVTLVLGDPNCTRLSALNASILACSRSPRVREKCLNSDTSRLRTSCVRSCANVAPALPNVNAAG